MSEYEQFKAEYCSINAELDNAIKNNKPYNDLLDMLFKCLEKMVNTPENSDVFDSIFREMQELERIMQSSDFWSEVENLFSAGA